jgi:DNA-directed RNA polymerase specialized sigma subunit
LGETQTEVAQYLGVSKMAISKAMAKIAGRGRRRLAPFRASDVML